MAVEEISRERVRDYLVKVKLYQGFIYVFVGLGAVVFCIFYFQFMEGDPIQAAKNPLTAVVLAMGFLPAIIFSWYVKMLENTLKKMMKKLEEHEKQTRQK